MSRRYSTLLKPLDKKQHRVFMLNEDSAMFVVDNIRTIIDLDVSLLPFSEMIFRAQQEVNDGEDKKFIDIGDKPKEQITLDGSDFLHLNYILFAHMLQQASGSNMWRKGTPKYFGSYVRESAIHSHAFTVLKMTTLRLILRGKSPLKDSQEIQKEYVDAGFSSETYKLYMLGWVSGMFTEVVMLLRRNGSLTVMEVEDLLCEAETQITKTNILELVKYRSSKLMFVAQFDRIEMYDIEADLLIRARIIYMMQRPFKSVAHATNYVRGSLERYVSRMIKHYTKPGVMPLFKDEKGNNHAMFGSMVQQSSDGDTWVGDYSDGFTEDDMIAHLDGDD